MSLCYDDNKRKTGGGGGGLGINGGKELFKTTEMLNAQAAVSRRNLNRRAVYIPKKTFRVFFFLSNVLKKKRILQVKLMIAANYRGQTHSPHFSLPSSVSFFQRL